MKVGHFIEAGDTRNYLLFAQNLAEGNLAQFKLYPFYQLYPLLLSPAFVFHIPLSPYVLALHALLSAFTVGFLALAGQLLVDRRFGWFAGIAASFYPHFFFWMPYLLSETVFLTVLSLFILSCSYFLISQTAKRACLVLAAFLLLVATRSPSVALAPFCFFFLTRTWMSTKLSSALFVALLLIGFVTFQMSPSLQKIILSNQAVSSHISLGARLSSNSFDEYEKIRQETGRIEKSFPANTPEGDIRIAFSEDGLRRIKSEPTKYLAFSLKRFLSYWLPAIYQGRWSLPHQLLDYLIGLALLSAAGSLFCFRTPETESLRFLLYIALSFSALHAFTYVDSDGRYRLPAEMALLLLTPNLLRFLPRARRAPSGS